MVVGHQWPAHDRAAQTRIAQARREGRILAHQATQQSSGSQVVGRPGFERQAEPDVRLAIAGGKQPVKTRIAVAVEIEVELVVRPLDIVEVRP